MLWWAPFLLFQLQQPLDIPDKNELVKGVYEIPSDAGNIRVKITDLLSESLEVDC